MAFNVAAAFAALTTISYSDQSQTSGLVNAPLPTETVDTIPPQGPPIVYTPPPLPPAPSIQEMVSSDEEKKRNIFFTRDRHSIREFRALRGDTETTGDITREEAALIKEITDGAREDARTYQMPVAVVATLHFAARQAGMDTSVYMERLTTTGGIVTGADRSGLARGNLFKFGVANWLYLMKEHGGNHGFGYFTDQIRVQHDADTGAAQVSVRDPAVLRQILSLRGNPRVSALMGAEYLQNSDTLPERITYQRGWYQNSPQIRDQQNYLLVLGFNLGIRGADGIAGPLTRAALQEFEAMSKPLYEPGQTTYSLLGQAAEQAVRDSEQYTNRWRTVTPADAFAIRHAAKVVDVDYGYMMELVSAESGFVSDITASTSSATGLFQFIDNTWLLMVKAHGAKYGLSDLADRITLTEDRNGYPVASVENPFVQKHILSLRTDPRLSALMGAEFVKENYQNLSASLPNRDITRTDQYLAHFLGSGNAVTFISRMARRGENSAAATFPQAAAANPGVFYHRGKARSFNAVYSLFSRKFDTEVFDARMEEVPMPRPRPDRPVPRPDAPGNNR